MLRLDGRVAIVTGAGGGVGRAHAHRARRRAALASSSTTSASRSTAPGRPRRSREQVVDEIERAGGEAVADTPQRRRSPTPPAPSSTTRSLRSAGSTCWSTTRACSTTSRSPRSTTPTSTGSSTPTCAAQSRCARRCGRPMMAQGHGRIVNTSSGAVFGSAVGTVYQTAKAALIGLTRSLALAGCRPRHRRQRDHADRVHPDDRRRPGSRIPCLHGAHLHARARRCAHGAARLRRRRP